MTTRPLIAIVDDEASVRVALQRPIRTYTGVTISSTDVRGKGAATFQNSRGVVVSEAKSDGAALSLGVSGFEVALIK